MAGAIQTLNPEPKKPWVSALKPKPMVLEYRRCQNIIFAATWMFLGSFRVP